jgi:carboxylesterase
LKAHFKLILIFVKNAVLIRLNSNTMSSTIIEGAEPVSHKGSACGVLVLHGFTGNCQSMRPITDMLIENSYSVEMPLLPGHGTVIEDMLDKTYEDFYLVAKEALLDLRKNATEIFVLGLSMGGTLACNLCVDFKDINGLILINPLLEPAPNELTEGLTALLDQGTEIITAVGSDIKKEGEKEFSYNGTPLKPLLSLFEGVGNLEPKLGEIKAKTLLFSSREDHVVPSSSGDLIAEKLKDNLKRIWLENSYHVATLDNDQNIILDKTLEFIREQSG